VSIAKILVLVRGSTAFQVVVSGGIRMRGVKDRFLQCPQIGSEFTR
jgi:hypothetical protein